MCGACPTPPVGRTQLLPGLAQGTNSLPRPWLQGALSTSTVHLGWIVVRKVLDILVLWSEFKCLGLLSHLAFVNLGTAEDSKARLQHPGPS